MERTRSRPAQAAGELLLPDEEEADDVDDPDVEEVEGDDEVVVEDPDDEDSPDVAVLPFEALTVLLDDERLSVR